MKLRVHGWLALAMVSLVGAGSGAGGCGGGSGSGGGGGSGNELGCFDYSAFDGKAPAKTFRKDVLPIFRRSCGLSDSCHGPSQDGSINLPPNQPYLGPAVGDHSPSDAVIKMILAGIVGVGAQVPLQNGSSAPEPGGLDIVAAGAPDKSFLMWKIDADFSDTGTETFCNTLKCAAKEFGCGDTMPQGGPELDTDDKTTIRLWIAQGAKDD